MIRLHPQPMDAVADMRQALQKAIELELSTLPPYLHAAHAAVKLTHYQQASTTCVRSKLRTVRL